MIPYRKTLLIGQWYKFVLNKQWYSIEAMQRAKRYCENDLDPTGWTYFNGGFYYIILIKEKEEADLFRLLFMGEKGIRGLITFS